MKINAVNNFVFILRDEAASETGGYILPDQAQEKPHHGTILSVGGGVDDPDIVGGVGKKCLFHKGNGFDIEFEGETFLVIEAIKIIGVV